MFEHLHTDANECLESLHTMSLLLMQKDSGPGITGKHWEESPVAVDFVASVTSKQPLSILRRVSRVVHNWISSKANLTSTSSSVDPKTDTTTGVSF